MSGKDNAGKSFLKEEQGSRSYRTMKEFTTEESNLICIYSADTRQELMGNLLDMKEYLEPDERELRELTDRVLAKLRDMSDSEYSELHFFPDFIEA